MSCGTLSEFVMSEGELEMIGAGWHKGVTIEKDSRREQSKMRRPTMGSAHLLWVWRSFKALADDW